MKGWLVVNAFFELKKFDEIYRLLLCSAQKYGISLELKKTDELVEYASNGFSKIILPDFVIFWDKDIYLAKLLENAGVRLFNSADAIEICDNKAKTSIVLSKNNIRTPRTIVAPKTFEGVGYTNKNFVKNAIESLKLPVVIKEVYGSFGQQVYLAETTDEAFDIVGKLGCKEFLIQEFIKESKGKDIRVNVVGGKVIASMLRENKEDFRSNITNGGTAFSYTPTQKECEIAISACRAVGLDFAGVDVLFGENGVPYICEINSNPHFKSTFGATGINLADYIMEYIGDKIK